MCVIAAMFSISCMPLVNWLAGVWVCVCMGVRAGKVVLCIPLSSCSLHIWDPSQSGGAGPWVLEKPKVTQERKGCRPGETGQGWMRRIVSQRRRITLQEDVVCLLHHLPPHLTCSLPCASKHKNHCLLFHTDGVIHISYVSNSTNAIHLILVSHTTWFYARSFSH